MRCGIQGVLEASEDGLAGQPLGTSKQGNAQTSSLGEAYYTPYSCIIQNKMPSVTDHPLCQKTIQCTHCLVKTRLHRRDHCNVRELMAMWGTAYR